MRREIKRGILKVVDIAFALGIAAAGFTGFGIENKKSDNAENKYREYLNSDVVMAQIDDDLTHLNKLYDEEILNHNDYIRIVYDLKENVAEKIYRDNAEFQELKEKRELSGLGWCYGIAGAVSAGVGLTYILTNITSAEMGTLSTYIEENLEYIKNRDTDEDESGDSSDEKEE